MRYDIDYSIITSHLFDLTLFGLLLVVALDVYARYYKVSRSTDEFDGQLLVKYVKLQRMRKANAKNANY